MLKSKIISFKYRRLLKNNLTEAAYSFSSTKNIGVLYNTDQFNQYSIQELTNELKKQNKTVHSLGFQLGEGASNSASTINIDQFDFWGSLKPHDMVDKFIEKKYDLLLCIDESDNFAINYLLTRIFSKFKVGVSDLGQAIQKFDLVIKCEKSKNKPSELIKYLKLIEV